MGFDWVYASLKWKIKAYGGAIEAHMRSDSNYQGISYKFFS